VVKNKRILKRKANESVEVVNDSHTILNNESINFESTVLMDDESLVIHSDSNIFDDGAILRRGDTIENDSQYHMNDEDVPVLERILEKYFDKPGVSFFKNHCCNNTGLSYLANLCMKNNDTKYSDDSKFHFSLANLCFNISKSNRVLLRSVLDEITKHASFSSVPIQINSNLRKQYIDGKENVFIVFPFFESI
jgi:hypothetical protein